jgi:hypothetical protein
MRVLTLTLLLTSLLFANEDSLLVEDSLLISDFNSQDEVVVVDTSLNSPQPDSALVDSAVESESDSSLVQDSLEQDTTQDDSSKTTKLVAPKNQFSIGASWAFGSNPLIELWVKGEEAKKDSVEQKLTDMEYNGDNAFSVKTNHLQEPTTHKIAFPISLGYQRTLSDKNSLSLLSDYQFMNKISIYNMYDIDKGDSTKLFESQAVLSHHSITVRTLFSHSFDTSYFSINGVDKSGISLGAGFTPFSTYIDKRVQSGTSSEKRVITGVGAVWEINVFTEKRLADFSQLLFSIGYSGSYQSGFDNSRELFPNIPESFYNSKGKITFLENCLRISVHLLFGKQERVEIEDELEDIKSIDNLEGNVEGKEDKEELKILDDLDKINSDDRPEDLKDIELEEEDLKSGDNPELLEDEEIVNEG